jgi:thymidylate synthase (FAD)
MKKRNIKMKLIESKAEYIPQEEGLEGIYKQIELAGRTAYHSMDKITPDSAKDFVDRMIKSRHGSCLEHGTVYLMVHTIAPEDWDKKIGRHKRLTIDDCRDDLRTNPTYDNEGEENWWAKEAEHKAHVMAVKYADNPYSKVRIVLTKHELNTEGGIILTPTGGMPIITKGAGKVISVFNTILITTNLRVLQENNWLDDLQYLCTPTEFHEKRYTMRFTCSRAIANELVRSRTMSFLQESQRYINYSKERHGEDITFIKPLWLNCSFENIPPESELCYLAKQHPDEAAHRFIASLVESKYAYMTLLLKGCSPQQARDVLPNATKTELIMTGFSSDWRHVMDLRLFEKTGKVHPDMKDLMQKAQKVMQEVGIWDDIMSKPSKFE